MTFHNMPFLPVHGNVLGLNVTIHRSHIPFVDRILTMILTSISHVFQKNIQVAFGPTRNRYAVEMLNVNSRSQRLLCVFKNVLNVV
jgi:hypothetical protein